jgi:hypothetical protein
LNTEWEEASSDIGRKGLGGADGVDAFDDGGGHLVERDHVVDDAELDGGAGHSEDDAGVFVFGEGVTACLFDGLHAEGSVGAHPGEDDGEEFVTGGVGGGAEEDVDGGPTIVNGRGSGEACFVGVTDSMNGEVKIAGGDDAHPVAEFFPVLGLVDFVIGQAVESVGDGFGEEGRDVLGDSDGGEVAGEVWKDFAECFDATGG